jgi:hypothetical protein
MRRQTLSNLAQDHKKSIPWIRDKIFDYEPPEQTYNPRPVVIVCDATFYGKRKDKLGTLVFKDITSNEILIWKHIESETVEDYKQLLHYLIFRGYTINAIISDGFKGLNRAFNNYPIQLCQFHQRKTINRYLTRNPKLDMAIDLQKIMRNLTTTTEEKFTKKLDIWYAKYKDILLERSINSETQKASYTHPKVVSAYRSIRRNIPYLFTYQRYPYFKINSTTNAIDGGVFSPMKKLMHIHAGLSKSLKLKIVDFYLVRQFKQ